MLFFINVCQDKILLNCVLFIGIKEALFSNKKIYNTGIMTRKAICANGISFPFDSSTVSIFKAKSILIL